MQTGASYINENQRSMDIQDHRDINKNRDDDTKYASNFSNFARSKAFTIGAISKQWRDFLNTKSINREDKLLNNMIENGGNIFRHTIFQGVNYELLNTIKDNTVGGSGNE